MLTQVIIESETSIMHKEGTSWRFDDEYDCGWSCYNINKIMNREPCSYELIHWPNFWKVREIILQELGLAELECFNNKYDLDIDRVNKLADIILRFINEEEKWEHRTWTLCDEIEVLWCSYRNLKLAAKLKEQHPEIKVLFLDLA